MCLKMTWFVILNKMQNDFCFSLYTHDSLLHSLLAGGYWGFHRGKPVPFANRAPSWILEARAPGYSGRAQKQKLFVNYRSPRSSASRNNSKMAPTKRTPGFLAEEKLQRLRVGYLLQKLYADTNFCTVSCFPICQKYITAKKLCTEFSRK